MGIRYAYRTETKRIKEPDFPYNGVALNSPITVASFVRSLEDAEIEKMVVLYLDAKHKLICIQITMGTVDRQVIYPREIVKHALLSNAHGIILCHNHPSGDPTPSPEDKNLTNTIRGACNTLDIVLLDHVIIGEGKFFSFQESRMM